MQTEAIPYSIILILGGVWLIWWGLQFTLGINRVWWQGTVSFIESYYWGSIPVGIAVIFLAIAAMLPLHSLVQEIVFWLSMFFTLLAIISSFGPPRPLKPKWLQDLEDRHPKHIRYLRDCARKLDTSEWKEIVHDSGRLRQWAIEEVHKYQGY